MMLDLDIQHMVDTADLPTDQQFEQWVRFTLQQVAADRPQTQLAIRIVDETEGAKLNAQWRHKQGATNVLSFSMSGLDLIAPAILGDIVICAPVVAREASDQSKALHSHWAHLVIHGVLHLLDYDHINADDAERMESLEINIMNQLGYPDPYQTV